MNKRMVAKELVKIARDLASADTFKCPNCGSKVLEQTGYCVKCKKKVKKAAEKMAKAEIDFQDIAKKIDSLVDEIDSHMNVYQRDYDRPVASQIDKATRHLLEAQKAFKHIEAYDEDPLG